MNSVLDKIINRSIRHAISSNYNNRATDGSSVATVPKGGKNLIPVDADACPVEVRDIVVRAAVRVQIPAVFVANKALYVPESPYLSTVQVSLGPDIVDAYIVEHAIQFDLAVTQDIPLAAELVAPKCQRDHAARRPLQRRQYQRSSSTA